jgi:hypothetical protein
LIIDEGLIVVGLLDFIWKVSSGEDTAIRLGRRRELAADATGFNVRGS